MEPQRTCIGCRRRDDKSSMTRLVASLEDGDIVIDHDQRLPGRGCYLHAGCAEVAIQRRAVGRALRRAVDAGQVAGALAALAQR